MAIWDPELDRILAIPSRAFSLPDPASVEAWSAPFRQPGASGSLLPLQVAALAEFAGSVSSSPTRGLWAPLPVGSGKTLLSGLLGHIARAVRPVLVVPGGLLPKTRAELAGWSRTWRLAPNLTIQSYQALSRVGQYDWLSRHSPDLIILDEAHCARNIKSATGKRLRRYRNENPSVRWAIMTGTAISGALTDISHLLDWALGDWSPLPRRTDLAAAWSVALGFAGGWAGGAPPSTGALSALAGLPMGAPCRPEDARRGLLRRIYSTPGTVPPVDPQVGARLLVHVRDLSPEMDPVSSRHADVVDEEMRTPDGWDLTFPMEKWKVHRELSLGMHYIWSPRPPEEWRLVRRAWCSSARAAIDGSRKIDSEEQLKRAVLARENPRLAELLPLLLRWSQVEPTFTPSVVPVWHSDLVLRRIAEWARENVGIIWIEQTAVAAEASKRLGIPFYGEKRTSADGARIEDERGDRSIIAGVDANCTGRNLQMFNRNLITAPVGARKLQQLIGRTHRTGQRAPEVSCDLWLLSPQHVTDWKKTIQRASKIQSTDGSAQKILNCEITGWDLQKEIDEMIEEEGTL